MPTRPDTPMLRSSDWLRTVPHLLAIVACGAVLYALGAFRDPLTNFLVGWSLVILYRLLIRYTLTAQHTRGLELVKRQRYQAAAEAFQRSLDFFERHPALDRYRSLIFLSPSRYGYREMALLNLGFVYGQLGKGSKAAGFYTRALAINPHNGIALSALNLINAGRAENDKN